MTAPNLTTLARVKSWLGISTTTDDTLLSQLISAASRFVYGHINMPTVAVTSYAERRDGHSNYWITPHEWPLISVESIQYAGYSITAEATGNPLNNGYSLQSPNVGPTRISVHGYPPFPQGKNTVLLNYTAGFKITDEEQTVPASSEYTISVDQVWAGNISVKDSGDNILTEVASGPASGEYSVSSTGVYTFNAAQAGEARYISYSYVPADLAQAVTELVGATYQSKDRIGIRSKSLGGQETISYFQNEITPHMALLLQPYMRVVPR